jgi:hypothetical protein
MISLTELVAGILITGFMRVPYATANADSSTGFVRDHRPTEAWSTQNKRPLSFFFDEYIYI